MFDHIMAQVNLRIKWYREKMEFLLVLCSQVQKTKSPRTLQIQPQYINRESSTITTTRDQSKRLFIIVKANNIKEQPLHI